MTGGLNIVKRLGQRGDTLVEVLICVLLVSLILTGAYVTTNRSSVGIRDAQEHAQALKLVQGQLEQLKQNAQTDNAPVFLQAAGTDFCMVNAVITTTAAPCLQNSEGVAATDQPAYRLVVLRTGCAPDYTPPSGAGQCHKFTVSATWDSIATKTQAVEQIVYRLYQQ